MRYTAEHVEVRRHLRGTSTVIPKAVAELTHEDIDLLITRNVAEGNQLDFKGALIGGADADKKKFAVDVCAFANTRGGDIVLGMREEGGVAVEVVPLLADPDREVLRIQSMVADSFDPRLVGTLVHPVPYGAGYVFVIRVPQSVQGLHRSKLDHQFHIRESRSNRSLDVSGLFSRFDALRGRRGLLEEFLSQRYATVLTEQVQIKLRPGPKLMLHIYPATAAFGVDLLDIRPVSVAAGMPVPGLDGGGADFRMTFEGPMHHSPITDGMARAYTLTHHNSVIEGCWKVADPRDGRVEIGAEGMETQVLRFVRRAVARARELLSLDAPLSVRLALVGAQGSAIVTENRKRRQHLEEDTPLSVVTQSALVFPEVLLTTWPVGDLPEVFRPVFDRMWQTSGYLRSYQYLERDGTFIWQGQV